MFLKNLKKKLYYFSCTLNLEFLQAQILTQTIDNRYLVCITPYVPIVLKLCSFFTIDRVYIESPDEFVLLCNPQNIQGTGDLGLRF